MSQDEVCLSRLHGEDIHAATASKIYAIPLQEVTVK